MPKQTPQEGHNEKVPRDSFLSRIFSSLKDKNPETGKEPPTLLQCICWFVDMTPNSSLLTQSHYHFSSSSRFVSSKASSSSSALCAGQSSRPFSTLPSTTATTTVQHPCATISPDLDETSPNNKRTTFITVTAEGPLLPHSTRVQPTHVRFRPPCATTIHSATVPLASVATFASYICSI